MKKAFEFLTNWVEVFFIILLLIGFLVSLFINNLYLSYGVVLLTGLASGKILYHKKKDNFFPHLLLMSGFILGYIIGNKEGTPVLILLLFIAGIMGCYHAHKRFGV
jgi:4-hydroxybenzoate polyprenyltransferase